MMESVRYTRKTITSQLDMFLLVMVLFFSSIMNLGIFPLGCYLFFSFVLIIGKRFVFNLTSYTLFFVFFVLLSISFLWVTKSPLENAFYATYLYAFLCFISIGVLIYYDDPDKLYAIKIVIKVHCSALVIQFILYLLFSYYLDLHKLISLFKYDSRYESNALSFLNIARSTGFSVEPSNAAAVISYLNICYLVMVGKPDKFFLRVQLATFLTLSFASIAVSASIIALSMLWMQKYNKLTLKKILILLFIFTFSIISAGVIYWRVFEAVDYDAIGYRMMIYEYFISSPLEDILFGQGIQIFDKPSVFNNVVLNSSHIRDSGFIVNMAFSFGVLGTILLLLLVLFFSNSIFIFFVIMLVFMMKFDYMQPVFWMAMFILVISSKRKKMFFSLINTSLKG